ncbi:porin [Burkholderia alba]|uniref:porin n=1 Tax=Burkholderia alba TaxID=2683677 RepID=UPI002B060163|nr:porin [Burkholderia alba]
MNGRINADTPITGTLRSAWENSISQGNRWSLRGSDNRGGGLSTIVRLENDFNLNTGAAGQGGRMFGRFAYVGLQSNQYGTPTFGRQGEAIGD